MRRQNGSSRRVVRGTEDTAFSDQPQRNCRPIRRRRAGRPDRHTAVRIDERGLFSRTPVGAPHCFPVTRPFYLPCTRAPQSHMHCTGFTFFTPLNWTRSRSTGRWTSVWHALCPENWTDQHRLGEAPFGPSAPPPLDYRARGPQGCWHDAEGPDGAPPEGWVQPTSISLPRGPLDKGPFVTHASPRHRPCSRLEDFVNGG